MIVNIKNGYYQSSLTHVISSATGLILITGMQIYLWIRFISRLHSLMNGNETVNAFFWKFMPVRALFLNSYGIEPEYIYANNLLSEALLAIEEKGSTRRKSKKI